jgi:hypothetical protein
VPLPITSLIFGVTDLHGVSHAVDSNTFLLSPLSKLLQQKEWTKENLICFNTEKMAGIRREKKRLELIQIYKGYLMRLIKISDQPPGKVCPCHLFGVPLYSGLAVLLIIGPSLGLRHGLAGRVGLTDMSPAIIVHVDIFARLIPLDLEGFPRAALDPSQFDFSHTYLLFDFTVNRALPGPANPALAVKGVIT